MREREPGLSNDRICVVPASLKKRDFRSIDDISLDGRDNS
jgi:hypothetical protein